MRLTLLSCLASAALLAAAGTANAAPITAGEQAGSSVNAVQPQPAANDEFSARRGEGGGGFGRHGGGGGRKHFGGGGGRMHFGGGGGRFRHFGGHRIRHAGFVGHRHGFVRHHGFRHRHFVRHRFFGPRFSYASYGGWCHRHWRHGWVIRHCHPYAYYPHHHRRHVRFVAW
jgi:hypothetical protein